MYRSVLALFVLSFSLVGSAKDWVIWDERTNTFSNDYFLYGDEIKAGDRVIIRGREVKVELKATQLDS